MTDSLIPMAIAYDFDGTLAPGNMQEYDFIPSLAMTAPEFWSEVEVYAREQDADSILAYMGWMLEKARAARIPIRKEDFRKFGENITLFPGVRDWFSRIDAYGRENGVLISHYIVSSGLREMVEGTPIASHFEKIYASGFMYDPNGAACWPALAVNYTTKTQYLFRISKGCLDVFDNSTINKYIPHGKRPMPFANMVFLGDGETDVPCMRLLREYGGHAIAVYEDGKAGSKERARQLVEEGRTTLIAPADYRQGEGLDLAMKAIVEKVARRVELERMAMKTV